MTLDLIYRFPYLPQAIQQQFFGMLLGAFFFWAQVSAITKMLTEQEPLQTTYSQLSLKRKPLGLPQSVHLRERCPFYPSVHQQRVGCIFS